MKSRFTKIAAAAMALTMCMPTATFAASTTPVINGETSGSFNTSFDVYSPALHISVPLKADIQVNPLAGSGDTVKQFSVASNSIDIINASVDTEADTAIPVNVTVQAAITNTAEGVVTEYKDFTADEKSTKKKINLMLTEAVTAATLDTTNRKALTGDQSKLLDLASVPVNGAAEYTNATNSTAITKYGSLLSVDIAVPTTEDTTNNSFTTDPAKVKPTVGSFAVTGVANTNADWSKDDIAVAITYKVKASKALNIVAATAAAVTRTASDTTDLKITVANVGEATVTALALHNDDAYKDLVWEGAADDVTYAPNTTTPTQTDATITIKKDDATLGALAGDDFKGKAQTLVIALSDGRMVVTDITVN